VYHAIEGFFANPENTMKNSTKELCLYLFHEQSMLFEDLKYWNMVLLDMMHLFQ
jgi:hypothetical protein